MLPRIELDSQLDAPLYRQLHDQIRSAIRTGRIVRGERLPPTRELAGSLGLNRTTIAAAYSLLESEGLIEGHVGRGSFVSGVVESAAPFDWTTNSGTEHEDALQTPRPEARISFAASRPSELLFPLDEFRATCREVIDSAEAGQILQLGPASGYGPLRHHLLSEARSRGNAGPEDDILITSGCQQALDLIGRVLGSRGETVLLEDPVYPGLRQVFQRNGARVIGVPVGDDGIDVDALGRAFDAERPRLAILTSNFQNPTGATIPLAARQVIIDRARRAGIIVVENDLYGELRYSGATIPAMKRLDESGQTILLSSFSKVAFPGLRVGWAIGPRQFIARLAEAKQAADLHSDQLSQAVLLRFAQSGRLAAHRERMIAAGAERLKASLAACARELPRLSHYTRPEGGMNLWVRLPDSLDASDLSARAEREGVSFLPGRYFAVSRPQTSSLRLSFAGLAPDEIRLGMSVLGKIFRSELDRAHLRPQSEPAPAIV